MLERVLGTDLFVRNSRQVALTPARRALLEEAPLALSALERAAESARLASAGIAGTVRLGYAPMAGYETLGAILAAAEHDSPNLTVVASELFSSEVPGRVLAGELDVGLALFPEPMRGVRSRLLRAEPLALVFGRHHRLAAADPVPVASLAGETLLMFPRELAPGYYDRVVAACDQHGFQPEIRAFTDPPPQAMVASLRTTREVGIRRPRSRTTPRRLIRIWWRGRSPSRRWWSSGRFSGRRASGRRRRLVSWRARAAAPRREAGWTRPRMTASAAQGHRRP